MSASGASVRCVLFLQGPLSALYARIGDHLAASGCCVQRINFCVGDWLHWRRPGARAFRRPLDQWHDYIARFLTEHSVTDLMLHGDRRSYHRIAARCARERGVRVFATELGYLRPDWMTIEHDATGTGSSFPKDPGAIRRLATRCPPVDLGVRYPGSFWRVAAPDVVYNLANVALRPLFPYYQRHTLDPPLREYASAAWRLLRTPLRERRAYALCRRLLDSKAQYFLLPLQLDWDLQIREGSRFSGMREVIEEVVASFARHAPPRAHLVVKSHPLENDLRDFETATRDAASRFGVAERTHYMDAGTLSSLLPSARGLITVNSSVGIDALLAGCPVQTLSPAIYAVQRLTCDRGIDRFWNEASLPDEGLVQDFVRALAGTVQVRGSIYHRVGQEVAAQAMAEWVLRCGPVTTGKDGAIDRENAPCSDDSATPFV